MEKLGIVIIDDERSARELIRELVADLGWVEVLGEAGDVDEALRLIINVRPDLLLLDIQMPGQDGFALIEQLVQQELNVGVIFITAYARYAIRALRASAFDYLLKPVKRSELISALEKFTQKKSSEKVEGQFRQLIRQLGNSKIKLRNRTGFTLVAPDEILCCLADSNYTELMLESGKKLTVSMNLGKVEQLLPEDSFARISRSAVINLSYLAEVDRKMMCCTLTVPVAAHLKVSNGCLKGLESACEHHFSIQKGVL